LLLWSIISAGVDQNAGISRGGQESIMSHVLECDIQYWCLIFLWGGAQNARNFTDLFTELCQFSRNVPIHNKCFLTLFSMNEPNQLLCMPGRPSNI
jgi:hypothetical protein